MGRPPPLAATGCLFCTRGGRPKRLRPRGATDGLAAAPRPTPSALTTLAQALGVSVEALLGEEGAPARRGPTPKLQKQLEQLSQLPRSKQRFVTEMLDAVLQQSAQ